MDDPSISKKRLDDLRSQLKHLEQKKRLLIKKLHFEKLDTLMLPTTVIMMPDTDTRNDKPMDSNEIKTKMAICMDAVTKNTFLQGLKSAYRFTGITMFPYKANHCVCVDTFYNRRFYESYFIILNIYDTSIDIIKHNLPAFIQLEYIDKCILPYDYVAFNRVISELLVAYVSRREQVNEFKKHINEDLAKIKADKASFTEIHIVVSEPSIPRYTIYLTYDNWASIYPTKVHIEKSLGHVEQEAHSYWTHLVTSFKHNTLLKAHTISRL